MKRLVLIFLIGLNACAGKQALRVDCESRLVPINGPIKQMDDVLPESHPEGEERQP
jgi:hypothetical protein